MRRRIAIFKISGFLILLVTLLICVLQIGNFHFSSGISILFLLWSEIAFFGGMIFIERLSYGTNQIILRNGCGVTLFFYSLSSFLLSLGRLFFWRWGTISFLSIQAVLFAVAVILCLIFISFAKNNSSNQYPALEASKEIDAYVNRLMVLKAIPANEKYGLQIGRLAEDLKFSNALPVMEEKEQLELAVSSLEKELHKGIEERQEEQILSLCQSLDYFIKKNGSKEGKEQN